MAVLTEAQEAKILTSLVDLGRKQLRTADNCDELVAQLKEITGKDIDIKTPASTILAEVKHLLLEGMENVAKKAVDTAEEKLAETADSLQKDALQSLNAMKPDTASKTPLQLYSGFSAGAKRLVWFLAIASVVCGVGSGVASFYIQEYGPIFSLLCGVIPAVVLLAMCVLPVKTFAYVAANDGKMLFEALEGIAEATANKKNQPAKK